MSQRLSGVVAGLLITLILYACGGGGSDNAPASTPIGTAVNLSELRGFIEAKASPGTTASYNVTGSSSDGTRFTGTITFTVSSPTVTSTPSGSQTVNVFKRQTTLSYTNTTITKTNTATYYCLQTGKIFRIVTSDGITYTPISQTLLPSSAKAGDLGADKELSGSDGSTEKSTWRIDSGTNGDANFVFLFTDRGNSGNVTSESVNTYTIKPNGNIAALEITVYSPSTGATATVSGTRN